MNLSIMIDYSKKSWICKKWREKHPIEFKDFKPDQKKRVFCQLLLSYISQGSFIDSKEGFSIRELINRVEIRRNMISSFNEIKETFEKSEFLNDYIYTQYYGQLAAPKNRFLHIKLSPQEIQECVKLLLDEEIIRPGEYYEKENEILYIINDSNSREKMVTKIDKNGRKYSNYKEIYTSTFFLTCDSIFSDVFFRMRLFWMFKKLQKEHTDWFTQIYGPEMHNDFFSTIKKEQRQEYENRMRKLFQKTLDKDNSLSLKQKEKIIIKKIKEEYEKNVKDMIIQSKKT